MSTRYPNASLRYCYFRLIKQMATILEFYFWFRLWLTYRRRHVILHRPTKFHSNRTTHNGVLASYRFWRWRPCNRKSTSGFGCSDGTRLGLRWKSIYMPNFDDIISIHGWDITTAGLRKRTADVLEFYFLFGFLLSLPDDHVNDDDDADCYSL